MSSYPFIAEIRAFTYSFTPRNWAFCGGGLISIAQNTALFSLVGTTYGGDGRTTFGVPDLQGRAPMGTGQGAGLTNSILGQRQGAEQVTLTTGEIPSHSHSANFEADKSDVPAPGGNLPGNLRNPGPGGKSVYFEGTPSLITMGDSSLPTTGGSQPHENRQPYLALRFCMALEGEYPARN